MPLPKLETSHIHTSQDYWSLPDGRRAELIDGELYDMAPPGRRHQEIAFALARILADFVDANGGPCKTYVAPFAVNPDKDDRNWVEPDVLVVCDPAKLTDRGCEGAPDLTVEVASPSSRDRDYLVKTACYQQAGVREYWIVDPQLERTTVYRFATAGPVPVVYPFSVPVPVEIFDNRLKITLADVG